MDRKQPFEQVVREHAGTVLRVCRVLLASHDAGSLAALLERAGGAPSTARATAAKVLRHAFFSAAPPAWDDDVLAAASVGAWARG